MNILEKVKNDGVEFVNLEFTDIRGGIKSTTIPVERLPEALEKGLWFDGSSIEGFTRICESDMFLKLDESTYAVLPWEKTRKVVRFICDAYTPDGKPFEGDPRHILKRVLAEAEKLGFTYNVGPELEFFLFRPNDGSSPKPVPHDVGGYFDFSPKDLASDVRSEIASAMKQLGMEVEMSHHEVAPGQHEIDFKYGDALTTADRVVTMKHTIKSIANSYGLYASFMPKPIFGENGSGMHVHQSLFKNGKNIFFDAAKKNKLSDIALGFIAGQMARIRELSAILSPTVNSYKRLVPGYEAAVYICWAQINRSALIRIPMYSPGREQGTRAELRCPDPSCNPYLAFAVMLAAGLDGIKKGMLPPEPVNEDVFEFDEQVLAEKSINTLPGSLGEAIDEMKKSDLVKQTLGTVCFRSYLTSKKAEWDDYRIQVTSWEMEKYFENT